MSAVCGNGAGGVGEGGGELTGGGEATHVERCTRKVCQASSSAHGARKMAKPVLFSRRHRRSSGTTPSAVAGEIKNLYGSR